MKQNLNETKVLSQAMVLFWQKGYKATTIESILEVTGLDRNKFNEAFGSKDELYLSAFSYYSF
ncbi:helix-turn-helix domain-containing protein [Niallia sp. XMNu-256]|uniref:TetR/AcrR family transcriptional regulator n=1 Tax=Niallia sp. XMNu-256 TaxID=3082444 RepID=UPI0030D45D9A